MKKNPQLDLGSFGYVFFSQCARALVHTPRARSEAIRYCMVPSRITTCTTRDAGACAIEREHCDA
jgi:hypothetical protein